MKRILTFALALVMALSLAACGGKTDNKGENSVDMTAQEIMDTLQEKLGGSFACDTAEDENRMRGYWGFDMDKIESWAAMCSENSSLNLSTAVIVRVKDGYAQDAAALLQSGYEQTLSYARMYDMDLQRVLQARLFVSGNYAALLILGAQGDWEASDEAQAAFAASEAAKVDAVWSGIFGAADNSIVIPADDGSSGFGMDEDETPAGSDTPEDDSQKEPAGPAEDNANQDDGKKDDGKKDDGKKDEPAQALSAGDVLASLKKSLGSSYTSDAAETEARMSGYWGLDMSQIESWAAECSANSSLNTDCAVVVKAKAGYAASAAAALQAGYAQILSYARMYDMDLQRALQARLFVSGDYVALLIEGEKPDSAASAEDQAKFAAGEAAKIDSAWAAIFGSAGNSIVIPTEDNQNGFDMNADVNG